MSCRETSKGRAVEGITHGSEGPKILRDSMERVLQLEVLVVQYVAINV